MTPDLRTAFAAASPRVTPRPMPVSSVLVYAAVLAVFITAIVCTFRASGIWAWSVGLVYLGYDVLLTGLVIWFTRPQHERPTPAAASRPTLCVVITAHNEALHLPDTIDAALAQSDPPDLIVIADDGSTDGTAAMLNERYGIAAPTTGALVAGSDRPALRWLQLPHRGKARALNAALLLIESDIMLTLDADTHLAPDALAHIRGAFAADSQLIAAGGLLAPFCDRSARGRIMQVFQVYEYVRSVVQRFAWMRIEGLILISGAFAAFRRDALVKVGGFDPGSLVEDYELTHRLHRYSVEHGEGWRLAMVGRAMARTEAPARLAPFLRQRRRWYAGFLQTHLWNRDITGQRRFRQLGTRMLVIKAFDTLQPVYGLAAFAMLPLLALTGRSGVALAGLALILLKSVVDIAGLFWSIGFYRRVTGRPTQARLAGAVPLALIEPFSFQLLRHVGAARGWFAFLRGSTEWGFHSRAGAELPERDLQ